jgi:hypothetical protein
MRKLPFWERNARRSRVYGGRLITALTNRPLRHNCCFYHIPKCGGTSLSDALHAVIPAQQHIGEVPANTTRRAASIFHAGADDEAAFYDDGEKCADVFNLREAMLLAFMANDCALVHGHVLFSHKADKHFGDRYKYVTMLRHPSARVVSNYRAAKAAGFAAGDFSEYLASFIGRAHAMHNLRYFSGRACIGEDDVAAALQEAKKVIEKFAVIGFVDAMDDFVNRFESAFGARISVGRHNVGQTAMPEISTADRRRLDELCAPDLALYDYARKMMGAPALAAAS